MSERGKEPLLSTALFKTRISNLGLVTRNFQWLLLMRVSFVVAVFLRTVRGYNAIETGVIFTAATLGVLITQGRGTTVTGIRAGDHRQYARDGGARALYVR